MTSKPSGTNRYSGAVITVMVVCVMIALLPTGAGGRASYVITTGNSMEPGIRQGDLVILREQRDYHVGEIVAYRHPRLGQVLHRIIGGTNEVFVLRGDNNTWVDDYQPTQEEIVGKQWIHLPGVGKWFDQDRQLIRMVFAALAGFLIVAPRQAVTRIRRARRSPARRQPESSQSDGSGGPAGILGPDGQTAMLAVGVLAIASLLLAVLAFSRSEDRAVTEATEYQHAGAFDYSAEASGNVYDDGTVDAGQPVYLSLVDRLEFGFEYELSSDLPSTAGGTYQLDAVVTYDQGLERVIPLVEETAFDGGAFSTSATLGLTDVTAYIDQVSAQLGTSGRASRGHAVSIVATVSLAGLVGAQPVEADFVPSLDFEFDGSALRLASQPAAGAAGGGAAAADPLKPIETGTVEQLSVAPATLTILVFDMNVSFARQIAVFGLVLSVLAGAALAGLYWSARRASEPRQIRARYRPLLVTVTGSDLGINGRIVQVASIEDLARVAEREGRMILHQHSGDVHDYFVQDVDVTYSYTVSDALSIRSGSAMEPSS